MNLRLIHTGPGITGALSPRRKVAEPRSNVAQPRPLPRPATVLHPSLYDWEANPDRPQMPQIVTLSLSVLTANAKNPVSVPRPQAVEAARIVEAWAKGHEIDPTPPHGTPRGA